MNWRFTRPSSANPFKTRAKAKSADHSADKAQVLSNNISDIKPSRSSAPNVEVFSLCAHHTRHCVKLWILKQTMQDWVDIMQWLPACASHTNVFCIWFNEV